ncbi:MAG: hypothetical protein K0R44_388 [Thermomicrobiales bacterium]|jgi:hypothetical protein|nr:hypothetical protein [Thermomicrobiales bacterium]MDF3015163.1 hypothetical protein [Thermomicrobiales bacterium]
MHRTDATSANGSPCEHQEVTVPQAVMSTHHPEVGSTKEKGAIAATVVMPDDFDFGTDDEQVSVTYTTYGFAGPSLTYHNEADPTEVGTYTGAQVRTAQSELGDLVTVTLEEIPDAQRRTLTLFVPAIYLDADKAGDGINVETLVVWTTNREGPLARDQVQTYEERRVSGTAKWVGA